MTRTEGADGDVVSFSGAAGEEVSELVAEQLAAFRDRFGREPGEDDPLFFDPSQPGNEPVPINAVSAETEIVKAMIDAGIPGALIYAYQQTGLLLTDDNWSLRSDEDIEEWNAAIARYNALHGSSGG